MRRATLPVALTLALYASSAHAAQFLGGDNIQIYYGSAGYWNDTASGAGFQAKNGGAFVDYSYPGTPSAGFTSEWTDSAAETLLMHSEYATAGGSITSESNVSSTGLLASQYEAAATRRTRSTPTPTTMACPTAPRSSSTSPIRTTRTPTVTA